MHKPQKEALPPRIEIGGMRPLVSKPLPDIYENIRLKLIRGHHGDLVNMGRGAVPSLFEALGEDSELVPYTAMQVLGDMARRNPAEMALLVIDYVNGGRGNYLAKPNRGSEAILKGLNELIVFCMERIEDAA